MLHLRLPRRNPAGHKGSFGQVAVFGGCAASHSLMIGAPALSALGALRAGCGLVRLIVPQPIASACLGLVPSATAAAIPCDDDGELIAHAAAAILDEWIAQADALVIGPGLGRSEAIATITLRAVQQQSIPVVVDADALNALADVPDLAREIRGRVILTPHPGEFARLATAHGIAHRADSAQGRISGAESLAQRLGVIVVLKGACTVVTDGHRTWVCEHSVPALAVPGSGDVLAGVIAGLIAQPDHHRHSLTDLACIGVEAHAIAGETWSQCHHASGGMLASELASLMPRTLEELRED